MKKNIHILPTDKPSSLFEIDGHLIINKEQLIQPKHYRNIYITSDEEIKEDDWILNVFSNKLGKVDKDYKNGALSMKYGDNYTEGGDIKNYSKIILTTDQNLINDGIQSIDDEFLEWFINNPSCESVEVKELLSNNGNAFYGYKIIIPDLWGEIFDWLEQEEPKRETLEEAAKRIVTDKTSLGATARNGFVKGANWQAERMYSEEEVEQIFNIGQMVKNYGDYKPYTFKEALKQFKKK
jgi:hypothetical protein